MTMVVVMLLVTGLLLVSAQILRKRSITIVALLLPREMNSTVMLLLRNGVVTTRPLLLDVHGGMTLVLHDAPGMTLALHDAPGIALGDDLRKVKATDEGRSSTLPPWILIDHVDGVRVLIVRSPGSKPASDHDIPLIDRDTLLLGGMIEKGTMIETVVRMIDMSDDLPLPVPVAEVPVPPACDEKIDDCLYSLLVCIPSHSIP